MLRNRFFQEILSELQNLGMHYDDFVSSRFNFDQLLISSIDKLRSNALNKCLESDKFLLETYFHYKIENSKMKSFFQHSSSIEIAIEQNQSLASNYKIQNKISSNI